MDERNNNNNKHAAATDKIEMDLTGNGGGNVNDEVSDYNSNPLSRSYMNMYNSRLTTNSFYRLGQNTLTLTLIQ